MRFVDEYRKKKLIDGLLAKIRSLDAPHARFMEVCGTHTMAIFRSGLRRLLGERIELVSGPGCPVCVTSQADIDRMIALARVDKVVLASFGDMLKVPGTVSSLEKERASGADIRVVYGPSDALALARRLPERRVIFLAVGFETTSPAVAAVVDDAARHGMRNFFVYCCHKTIPPAMKALLDQGDTRIDGFLCPGHVSSIIGSRAYSSLCREYGIPCVVSGFEPADILASVLLLLRQHGKKAAVICQYGRAVRPQGNIVAQRLLSRVFRRYDADWRGLGMIPGSGLALRNEFKAFDAAEIFSLSPVRSKEDPRCRCGAVLRGRATPAQCALFGRRCTPENPAGPCMVSTEGTCAAWYKYNRDLT